MIKGGFISIPSKHQRDDDVYDDDDYGYPALTKKSLDIINDNIVKLIIEIDKTPDETDKQIKAINDWKANYLMKNHCIKRFFGFRECSKNEAMKNAEAKDILIYIQAWRKNGGGKRKSLRPHKKSKKRKQTKHMKKGKNGKKSKTKKVKRSRH